MCHIEYSLEASCALSSAGFWAASAVESSLDRSPAGSICSGLSFLPSFLLLCAMQNTNTKPATPGYVLEHTVEGVGRGAAAPTKKERIEVTVRVSRRIASKY